MSPVPGRGNAFAVGSLGLPLAQDLSLRAIGCFCGGFDSSAGTASIELLQRLGYTFEPRFTLSAGALVVIGVCLAAWAWFRDKWRRRGAAAYLCPRCHYDLRGIVEASAYPLKCSECALDIRSEQILTKVRRAWRLLGIALVVFVSAHVTALWPRVQSEGWMRLVPSTVLVLQPMDVNAWTEAELRLSPFPMTELEQQLSRRLKRSELWSWQEWILLKRVERSCRARDDFGITSLLYDMAVTLETTPANTRDQETTARRLAGLAETADVPFLIDWGSLLADGWHPDDLLQPVEFHISVARAFDEVLRELESWPTYTYAYWDITPHGVVLAGGSRGAATSRVRIYDVSDFLDNADDSIELIDLITEAVDAPSWIINGGVLNAVFEISDHLVIVARTRAHFEIEDLLENLRRAFAAKPPFLRPHQRPGNPRAFVFRSEYYPGLLDNLRLARTISIESLRSAGPTFDDGVTEDELTACNRGAFGLLDTVRDGWTSSQGSDP